MIYSNILVATILCLLGFVDAHDEINLRKLIFHDDPDILSPEKTQDYLHQLWELKPEDKSYLYQLMELGVNHAHKCDQLNIKEFMNDFMLNQKDSRSMEAYKLYQWNNRKIACKDTWKKQLQAQVHTLTPDEEQLVNQLTRSVLQNIAQSNYKSSFLKTGTREFASGILPYFVKNIKYPIKKLLKGKEHDKIYEEELQRLVLNICQGIESKFGKSIELFKWFIYFDESNYVDDDQSTKFWLENIEVCKTINRRKLGIKRELYKLLKNKYPQPGCFGGCLAGSNVME